MVGPLPEQRIDRPLGRMRWDHVTFLHWAYDPATVQPLVPPGFELDTRDGAAWIGLAAFLMADVRPAGLPPVPVLSTFPEINVRTYIRDRTGTDGLLFLTLEASRLVSLVARPSIGIAYAWARMAVSTTAGEVRYVSRRRWPRDPSATCAIRVRIGDAIPVGERTDFDHWLTGRWRAFSTRWGQRFATPVEHEPWPLHTATAEVADASLLQACGLPPPRGEPVVHYAPAVHVAMAAPHLLPACE